MNAKDFELLVGLPAFAGCTKSGIEHFLLCSGGKLLSAAAGEPILPDRGRNLLCIVLEGSLSLKNAHGEEKSCAAGELFSYGESAGSSMRATAPLRLLCFDAARAFIPCGEGCAFHIAFSRNLASLLMNRELSL